MAKIEFSISEGRVEMILFGENMTAELQMYGYILIDVERGWQVEQEVTMTYKMQVMGLESKIKALISSKMISHEIPP